MDDKYKYLGARPKSRLYDSDYQGHFLRERHHDRRKHSSSTEENRDVTVMTSATNLVGLATDLPVWSSIKKISQSTSSLRSSDLHLLPEATIAKMNLFTDISGSNFPLSSDHDLRFPIVANLPSRRKRNLNKNRRCASTILKQEEGNEKDEVVQIKFIENLIKETIRTIDSNIEGVVHFKSKKELVKSNEYNINKLVKSKPTIQTIEHMFAEIKSAFEKPINGDIIVVNATTAQTTWKRQTVLNDVTGSMDTFHDLMDIALKAIEYVTLLRNLRNKFLESRNSSLLVSSEIYPDTYLSFITGGLIAVRTKIDHVNKLTIDQESGIVKKIRCIVNVLTPVLKSAKTTWDVFHLSLGKSVHCPNRIIVPFLLNTILASISRFIERNMDLHTLLVLYIYTLKPYLDITHHWFQEGNLIDKYEEFVLADLTTNCVEFQDIGDWDLRSLSIEYFKGMEDLNCFKPWLPNIWKEQLEDGNIEFLENDTIVEYNNNLEENVRERMLAYFGSICFQRFVENIPQHPTPPIYDPVLAVFRDQILPLGEKICLMRRMDLIRGVQRKYLHSKVTIFEEFYEACKNDLCLTDEFFNLETPNFSTESIPSFEIEVPLEEDLNVNSINDSIQESSTFFWSPISLTSEKATSHSLKPSSKLKSPKLLTIRPEDLATKLFTIVKRRVLVISEKIKRTLLEDHHLDKYLTMFRSVVYLNTKDSLKFMDFVFQHVTTQSWICTIQLNKMFHQIYNDENLVIQDTMKLDIDLQPNHANDFSKINDLRLNFTTKWPINIFTNDFHVLVYQYFFSARLKFELASYKLRNLTPAGRKLEKFFFFNSLRKLFHIKWLIENILFKIRDYCFLRSYTDYTRLYHLKMEKAKSMDSIYTNDLYFLQRMFQYVKCIIDTPVGKTGMEEFFQTVESFVKLWGFFFNNPETFDDEPLTSLYENLLLMIIYLQIVEYNINCNGINFVDKHRLDLHDMFIKLSSYDYSEIEFIPETQKENVLIWTIIETPFNSLTTPIQWSENYFYKPRSKVDYLLKLQHSNFNWDVSLFLRSNN